MLYYSFFKGEPETFRRTIRVINKTLLSKVARNEAPDFDSSNIHIKGTTNVGYLFIPVFHQGDEGKSWYIIIQGSVDVVIYGKGCVTSLYAGEDFGKLALVNNAPRWVL